MSEFTTSEDLNYLFPITLFSGKETQQNSFIPIHFVLDLKTPLANYKELEVIVKHCHGEMTTRLVDATPCSVLLVDHDDVVNFIGPAFKMEFLQDCLEQLKKVDIHKYRQKATSHIAKDANLWNIIYFRTETWDSILTDEEKSWIRRNASPDDIAESDNSVVQCLQSQSQSHRSEPNEGDENEEEIARSESGQVDSSDTDCESLYNHIQESTNPRFGQDRQSTESTPTRTKEAENENISKHNKEGSHGKLNGETTEKENINLNDQSNAVASGSLAAKEKKWAFLDEFEKDSDSDSESWPHPDIIEKVDVKYKDPKHSRAPYTMEERKDILQYIVRKNEFRNMKGNRLWKTMEQRRICPFRTWQSMKEHLIKKIVPDLDSFDFLTNEQRRKIKNMFE